MVDPEWLGTARVADSLNVSVQAVRKAARRLDDQGSPHVRLMREGRKETWLLTDEVVRHRIATDKWDPLLPDTPPAMASPDTSATAPELGMAELASRLDDQRLRADLAVSAETSARLEAKDAEIASLRAQLDMLTASVAELRAERDALRAEYRGVLAARAQSL